MEDTFRHNSAYIRQKHDLLVTLTEHLYRSSADIYASSHHAPPLPDELTDMYEEISESAGTGLVSAAFAQFCLAFSKVCPSPLSFLSDAEPEAAHPKIAYMQNSFSDRAYRQFSTRFERTSASYYPGFREICEEVYNGNCSYAMLPIYNSRDGQLISFRRLISKYDLKIALVTDVEATDDSIMRFALVKRGISRHAAESYPCLDLFVVLDNTAYGTFLSACESLGALVLMMHSLPLEYSDDGFGLALQLDIRHAAREALFSFLEASHIRYDIIGIYDIQRP